MFRAILVISLTVLFAITAQAREAFYKDVDEAYLNVRYSVQELIKNHGCQDVSAHFMKNLGSPEKHIRFATQRFVQQLIFYSEENIGCAISKSVVARGVIENFVEVSDVADLKESEQKYLKRSQSSSRNYLEEALKGSFGSKWLEEAAKTLRPPLAVENAFSNLICSDVEYTGSQSILEDVLLETSAQSDREIKFKMARLKNRLQRKCKSELKHATTMSQKMVCMWTYFAVQNTEKADYLHFPPSMEDLYKSYGKLNPSNFERVFSSPIPENEFSENEFLQEFPQTSKIGMFTRRFQLFLLSKIVESCETRFSEKVIAEIQSESRSVQTSTIQEFGLRLESVRN